MYARVCVLCMCLSVCLLSISVCLSVYLSRFLSLSLSIAMSRPPLGLAHARLSSPGSFCLLGLRVTKRIGNFEIRGTWKFQKVGI